MDRALREAHFDTITKRLRRLMAGAGIDALVATKSENLTYVNTLPSAFLSQSGMASIAMAVVPGDGEVFGICCDFEHPALASEGTIATWYEYSMWIFIDDQFLAEDKRREQSKKSEFFELGGSIAILADRLKAAGLDRGRIGIELGSLQVPVWEVLKQALPGATFVDATQLFYGARALKTPYEIECLRHGARIQEEVVFGTMAEIAIGMTHAEILARLRSRAMAASGIDGIRFMFVSIGALFSPAMVPYERAVRPGDLVKYDGALVVRGYGADSARTFIAGEPSADQRRVNHALVAAHMAALDMMGPGVVPRDVFEKAMRIAREEGLPHFNRGHIGHSVGLDQTIEEPPFISGISDTPMVPGNVFCVELPYYAHNFGSIMNEDIVLITESGRDLLTVSERTLHRIGGGG